MAHDRKILASHSFLEHNPRWGGAAEVVHRTSTFEDSGTVREFIDLSLRVGERSLNVPIKDLDKVIEALKKMQPLAEQKLMEMLASQPPREDRRNDRGGGHRDRGDRRGRGHRED